MKIEETSLIKQLKQYYYNSDLSMCELAKKLRIKSKSSIYFWFNGIKPNPKNLYRIKKFLDEQETSQGVAHERN